IRSLADAVDVSLGDLLGEPSLLDWSQESGRRTVPALRDTLLNYRQLTPFLPLARHLEPAPTADELREQVTQVWDAYQASRYGFVVSRLPILVRSGQAATLALDGDNQAQAFGLLGLAYQAAGVLLTKLGETDLAWIAAERGFAAAQRSGDPI